MTDNLTKRYFQWMQSVIGDGARDYHLLEELMFNMEFTYILSMDGNRLEDGIDLRYRFGYEMGIPDAEIAAGLDTRPCSILEMMVALSNRIEESIMGNAYIGDRTGEWFWDMVKSLGLYHMDDIWFDEAKCREVLERFLERRYQPDGKGGLFHIPNPKANLRGVDIWCQAMWFIESK